MGLLIKNGTIVSDSAEWISDILVEGEKIVSIAKDIPVEGHEVVDATGKYVFPGGVDEHVHMGPFDSYSFETSHAALVGGTTTLVDFSPQYKGMGVIESLHKHNEEDAVGKASPDYSFHAMIMENSDKVLDEIPHMVDAGIVNLKLFMAYKYTPFMVEDDLIFKCMQEAKKYGISIMVHAENGDLVDILQKELRAQGAEAPINHSYSRPPLVEDEATSRAIYMAELADCPLFVVHVTTKGAFRRIKEAHERGLPVYGETCTHYLVLDESYLAKPNFEGAKYVCAPALRTKDHGEVLWKAVQNGELQAISSDHAAVVGGFEAKKRGLHDFTKIPNGAPGMQDRLHMVWTQGVEKGRITRQDFVRLCMTNPAKVCGIFPQKGALLPGSDADILIFDPTYRGTITLADQYEGTDYAAYEGFEKKGIADKVYLRGKLMAERGKFVGERGQGRYIKPKPYTKSYEEYHKKKD